MGYRNSNFKTGLSLFGCVEKDTEQSTHCAVEHMWGSTLDAKLVRKVHPVVWKWPKKGQLLAKTANFGH